MNKENPIRLMFNGTNSSYFFKQILEVNNFAEIIEQIFDTDDQDFYKTNKNAILEFHHKNKFKNQNLEKMNKINYKWHILGPLLSLSDWSEWSVNYNEKCKLYKKLETYFLKLEDVPEKIHLNYATKKYLNENINKNNVKQFIQYVEKNNLKITQENFFNLIYNHIKHDNKIYFISLFEHFNLNPLNHQKTFDFLFFPKTFNYYNYNTSHCMDKESVALFLNYFDKISEEEKSYFFNNNVKFPIYPKNQHNYLGKNKNEEKITFSRRLMQVIIFCNSLVPENEWISVYQKSEKFINDKPESLLIHIKQALDNKKQFTEKTGVSNLEKLKIWYEKINIDYQLSKDLNITSLKQKTTFKI